MTTAYRTGVLRYYDRVNSRSHRVLTYHGIVTDETGRLTGTDISEAVLRRQIELLKKRYRIVPLSKIGRGPDTIAITFDDGSLSDLLRAAPILREHKVFATFFVCTDLVSGIRRRTWNDEAWLTGLAASSERDPLARRAAASMFAAKFETTIRERREPDPYLRLREYRNGLSITEANVEAAAAIDPIRFSSLHTDEVRQLSSDGHEIGSHTASHPILAYVSGDDNTCRRELIDSREILRECSGQSIDALSYPFGGRDDVDARIVERVRSAGYERAYWNIVTADHSPYKLGRLSAPGTCIAAELYSVTSGFKHFVDTGRSLSDTEASVRSA